MVLVFIRGNESAKLFVLSWNIRQNAGEKKFYPVLEESASGVVFLTNEFFYNLYGSFNRIAILIHEARHESREFMHVPCLNSNSRSCDNAPDGPYGLFALFLAYIVGICGDNCSAMERGFLMDTALWSFGKINLYQSENHKIHSLLEDQLEDWPLALDIYDVMVSLERQRDEDFEAIKTTL